MPDARIRPPRNTHKIETISYRKDELTCICGWKGWAYDRLDNEDGKHWPTHKKEAPPYADDGIDYKYIGSYPPTKRKKLVQV